MDTCTDNLITPVQLWVPRSLQAPCAPIDTLAALNTAHAQTFIQEGVATSLGLETTGLITMTTATQLAYEARQFLIRIVFPADNLSFEVFVVEVPYMPQVASGRIKCLIGRDILQYGVLAYDGPGRACSLTFRGGSSEQRDSATTN